MTVSTPTREKGLQENILLSHSVNDQQIMTLVIIILQLLPRVHVEWRPVPWAIQIVADVMIIFTIPGTENLPEGCMSHSKFATTRCFCKDGAIGQFSKSVCLKGIHGPGGYFDPWKLKWKGGKICPVKTVTMIFIKSLYYLFPCRVEFFLLKEP